MLQMLVHQKNLYGKVNLQYAIISSGKNDDDHPGIATLERLKNIGLESENKNLYITEEVGTNWLQSDGKSITIKTTCDINFDSVDNKKKQVAFITSFLTFIERKNYYNSVYKLA